MERRDLILELCHELGDADSKDGIVQDWEANHVYFGIEDFITFLLTTTYIVILRSLSEIYIMASSPVSCFDGSLYLTFIWDCNVYPSSASWVCKNGRIDTQRKPNKV